MVSLDNYDLSVVLLCEWIIRVGKFYSFLCTSISKMKDMIFLQRVHYLMRINMFLDILVHRCKERKRVKH
jgi:hypothetical protein